MLRDVVVDTNVFAHAQNPDEERFDASLRFVRRLLDVKTLLCIDPGFKLPPDVNRSLIGAEYLEHLHFGSFAFNALATLLAGERTSEIKLTVPHATKKRVLQLIRKPRDRSFLIAAINSNENVFVSHDYEDFQVDKRECIRREFAVRIQEAKDTIHEL